jgi:hypothetical protein
VVTRAVPFTGQNVSDRQDVEIYDVLGLDATLFHFSATEEGGQGAEYVRSSQRWFDSLWSTIAKPLTLFE